MFTLWLKNLVKHAVLDGFREAFAEMGLAREHAETLAIANASESESAAETAPEAHGRTRKQK